MTSMQRVLLVTSVSSFFVAPNARGVQAQRSPALGPEASAVVGAYGALAQDPSSVRFNPADIVFAPKLWSTAS